MKKDQHIKYALENNFSNTLEDIRLEYCSLPSINPDQVDISTKFCGINFKYPIYINAMTGGSELADNINKRLYKIAQNLDIFMFSGSYSEGLKNRNYYYPKNIGANIGADKSIENMKRVVEETEAKILQIHLNPIQEFLMKDGECNFSSWEENIRKAIKEIKVPIIIKETGYGMSDKTLKKLLYLGAKTVDISSRGGTDFSYIEDRRADKNRSYIYSFGYNLKTSLLASQKYTTRLEILASGGIENSMQVVKCLSMGARAVGISGYILKLLETKTDEEIIDLLKEMIYEIRGIIAITNSRNLEELKGKWEEIK